MIKDSQTYSILIIEDNPGDKLLVETYLEESVLIPRITGVGSYREARDLIKENKNFDIILLDLSLPDMRGEELINAVMELAGNIPVVVLTGYSDVEFSRKSVKLGVADYLLKDELTASTLYKSVIYSIERKRIFNELEESQKRYKDLFQLSPIPNWVYDLDTWEFLDVNEAAISAYGYSHNEFLKMKVHDLIPEEDLSDTQKHFEETLQNVPKFSGEFRHIKKNRDIIAVETSSTFLLYNGKPARMMLANDITFKKKYIEAIEIQNKKLKEIAWIQSHVVRAPLARLMGLVNLLSEEEIETDERKTYSKLVMDSATELDKIIRDITEKTEQININKIK
ncbi:two-component hybrid sensor and regulator [Indibacter alkaliphilus LW1]|uniref:Two-component hybrid sensor and regulator n=1 Tax=Indibacter alkaliphilus (strain CCUG 57479 / KCTC 22604 / LW1) TaxID=1189612 RepID=S2D942_INDAL|nr:response regulator [Indibacter alkaliphilus]EOZ95424.1 two-component hybrid sensor and regulator [Indibacter alkaliphilus LW1]